MFPVSSISAIVAVYVAQNIGAGNIKRAKDSVKQGMLMGVAIMALGISILLPFRHIFVNLFSHDVRTVELAIQYMVYIGISLPLMAVFQTFLSTFQGSGDTNYSFLLAIIRLWVFRLPFVILTMKFTNFGPAGIWYSMMASNFLSAFVGAYLYSRVKFTPKIRLRPIG
jgi:Na+-driven multidrug efflux pump